MSESDCREYAYKDLLESVVPTDTEDLLTIMEYNRCLKDDPISSWTGYCAFVKYSDDAYNTTFNLYSLMLNAWLLPLKARKMQDCIASEVGELEGGKSGMGELFERD